MHVCIVFYFQQLPWHTCNIFLSEEKLNKESNAQGFPVRRETPESLSLSLPVRLQWAPHSGRAAGGVGPGAPAGHCQPGLCSQAQEAARPHLIPGNDQV